MQSEKFVVVEVQGVKYRVVTQSKIRKHLSTILLNEWGIEEFNVEWHSKMNGWDWTVEILKVSDIKLWTNVMEDSNFLLNLEERVEIQKDRILQNQSIEPIVVRGRDMVLYDGYARFHSLKRLGKHKVLAYVGT
uniref:ParB/Sulfiredoxin domain-containing protein n=1 Tax=uncultured marine crenarchaeote E37-7F TaxID=907717 RepID=G9BAQ4_9ARCH|nr:hypothetical protein E37-7F_27 [uncultured marine crenarchaeote E37-7F]